MNSQAESFLLKQKISKRDIMYLLKSGRKTALHLKNGTIAETYLPAKLFLDVLPNDLIVVNKGVILSKEYIVHVENGIYTMTDGSQHKGRVRTPGKHKLNQINLSQQVSSFTETESLVKSFSILNGMPLPCCILELVFDANGHGMDFLFRYCNNSLAKYYDLSVEDIIDHSFYEVTKSSDKRSFVNYADVAMNGTSTILTSFKEKQDETIKIYCFQPAPNFCACILVTDETAIP